MSDLLELALRVEALTGPDREVDGEIDRLINNRPKHGDHDAAEVATWRIKDGWSGLLVRGDGFARAAFCAANYSASLDAAMTLVPDRWRLRQMSFSAPCADDRKWHVNLHGGREGEDHFVGRGKTQAIALAAAALRALAPRTGGVA